MDEERQERFAHFDKMGEEAVPQYALQWQGQNQQDAFAWLKRRFDEKERREAENANVARSSQRAAWAAVLLAIVAIIISVVALRR
jgi:hypothetical protein